MVARTICVGAVQMMSENGERDANLERASRLVSEAAGRGAKLVALPELFSGGYWLNEQAWETAERQDGPTESWLRETARRHDLCIGGSYLLARDGDFYNVFALATPDGRIAGRIPKQQPGFVEAYLFRGEVSSHVLATDLGRIGIGICYDNVFRFTAEALIAGNADIVLMSFSAPTPQQTWYYGRKQAEAFLASYRHGAQNYARMLGIPAVQVNKSGPWKSRLPACYPAQDSSYGGQSEIADSNGEIVAELADQETVIVGNVTLDPARKVRTLGKEFTRYGRWIAPVPTAFKLNRLIEAMGAHSYRANARRRAKAHAITESAHY